MIVNYVISDLVASLNVAKQGHLKRVRLNYNDTILIVLKKLQDLGLIGRLKIKDKKKIEIYIKYAGIGAKCVFHKIYVISKPSKKVYLDLVKFEKFKWKSYADIYLVSTKLGLLTNFECYLYRVSGEIICKIEL